MSEITHITATILRRKLRPALKSVETGARVVITRHNKVVAALIGREDYDKLTGGAPISAPPPAPVTIVVPEVAAEASDETAVVTPPPPEAPPTEKLITAL